MSLSDDQLRAALRDAAAGHRPDREAMLDRIGSAAMQDTGVRQRGSRLRMAAVAGAVALIFGGGGVGTWALTSSPAPAPAPPAPAPGTVRPSPADTAPVSVEPSPSAVSSKPSPARTTTPPEKNRVEQGPIWSDGSVVDGSSVVTVKTTAELTSLEVVIRVARTDGLVTRGGVKKVPGASVTTTVTEETRAFVYRFVMSPSDTLAPGTYTFTARYTHPDGGRDAGGDTYQAVSGDLQVSGDFF
ncbi:hypothetical protein [Actinoplanes couchii]|uniref:Uncharacterized protein n=1 Tax=Actinoplanes couchii TaxID=403638 RepID=A0ABQ3X8T1_9ACTN|nr:hypothetical protein [Actinoplanes couchii]MDR6325910.1 hypothetical protein [Actinoplanes couchii]GID54920.1 hypothetical protein Aco03nite_033240 [Actinoplanes couchii]